MPETQTSAIAILPVNDIPQAEQFFALLGFFAQNKGVAEYRILHSQDGAELHLTQAVPGWVEAGRNPFGLYFRRPDVDALAHVFAGQIIEKEGPSLKPWGMYEFAVNGPDGVLVRIGWPARA
ncbi:VOC family protein [Gluconobacter roseus]|uniref:Glyoxalase n=1 Tax=Gluconobacter roseus NBRC 3990 TaxID=1307950 RepID=A0A4Y3MBT7_9PROT|nr:hypothetical protein [Gluconobacter roseus]KXV43181.1 hypothetical protein AD943_09410 [Gluconobacter roseus]GEB03799.1 glyoxalase [Gluconobacter roseus NBRC 3990]